MRALKRPYKKAFDKEKYVLMKIVDIRNMKATDEKCGIL